MYDFWRTAWDQDPADLAYVGKEPGTELRYDFPLKKLKVGNCELAYVDEGPEEGPALVFLHGVGGGIPVWNKNIPELSRHFRCIAPDLPGHGFSTKADFSYTMRFYTEQVLGFLKALDLSSVALVGHSMGGQIAVLTALRDRQRVSQLILSCPSGIEPYFPAERTMLLLTSAAMVNSGNAFTNNSFTYHTGFCYDLEQSSELIAQLAFFRDEADAFGNMILRSTEGMLVEPIDGLLDQVEQECLLLIGEEDRVSPYNYLRNESYADIAERMGRSISKARIVRVPDGGHFIHYQLPGFFNEQVLQFVAKKEPSVQKRKHSA
ncbi:MAG: alpha/beta fold hydrolase [Bacteroidia bacterium]